MSDPNNYYTKEAIKRRVFGQVEDFCGSHRGRHEYSTVESFAHEIIAASNVGDPDFLNRVIYTLLRQQQQQSYEKGIADTKADIRRKLGLS